MKVQTEVLVHLIEFIRDKEGTDLIFAVQIALSQVVGSHVIAILEKNNPDCIIAARKSSPLVVGIGEVVLLQQFLATQRFTRQYQV